METNNQDTQSIASKLVSIMQECSHIGKTGQNDYHGYRYATCADVLDMVNTALAKHQICTIATPDILQMTEITNSKGGKDQLATVKVDILLIDSETGETVTISGIGSGQDPGDKAVMKAQTAAIKYAYLLSFAISTGDDPEQETSPVHKSSTGSVKGSRETTTAFSTGKPVYCSECGAVISEKVASYSRQHYDRPLCLNCQHTQRRQA